MSGIGSSSCFGSAFPPSEPRRCPLRRLSRSTTNQAPRSLSPLATTSTATGQVTFSPPAEALPKPRRVHIVRRALQSTLTAFMVLVALFTTAEANYVWAVEGCTACFAAMLGGWTIITRAQGMSTPRLAAAVALTMLCTAAGAWGLNNGPFAGGPQRGPQIRRGALNALAKLEHAIGKLADGLHGVAAIAAAAQNAASQADLQNGALSQRLAFRAHLHVRGNGSATASATVETVTRTPKATIAKAQDTQSPKGSSSPNNGGVSSQPSESVPEPQPSSSLAPETGGTPAPDLPTPETSSPAAGVEGNPPSGGITPPPSPVP